MSIRHLDKFFHAHSVAVIGASARVASIGATVLRNLQSGGFHGELWAVNPKYSSLAGQAMYHSVADLPGVPDLAVICTPPDTVPGLIAQLGNIGTKAVVVLTAGLTVAHRQAMLTAARPHLLRILGPNCLGLLVPRIGLNASFAHVDAQRGRLALVSQSGALVTAVLDWAKARGIGFASCVSIGDALDVDVGDVLDYLAGDPNTSAILLYLEDVKSARKFMSAARSAARAKPVLVVKAGRAPEGARAAASHTGALAGVDAVYDAAFRRAGMLRVLTMEEMFAAVETLALAKPPRGERVAILTNGGGPGVLAADALALAGGQLAELAPATVAELNSFLPPTWSHANPLDIIGDADGERYRRTLEVLGQDPGVDAILLVHAPTALAHSEVVAQVVAQTAASVQQPLFTCWLGATAAVEAARTVCLHAHVPAYDTPEDTVAGFLQLSHYRQNQAMLMEAPPASATSTPPNRHAAHTILKRALATSERMLSEPDAKDVLAAYGIPVVQTRVAHSADEAAMLAADLGFPVALKILSPAISHKTDVGGVALDLADAAAVRAAAKAMLERVANLRPDAVIDGFSVQAMVRGRQALELIAGASTDPVFGPVILFGHGGTAVSRLNDSALELAPLNLTLARRQIERTRVSRLFEGARGLPTVSTTAVAEVLVRLSALMADLPEVAEIDINPLLADASGVLALDARIVLRTDVAPGTRRFAICPYPAEQEEQVAWQGELLRLRPVRPEDAAQHKLFFQALDPSDVRLRFFEAVKTLDTARLARLTQIDYEREMAFIAERTLPDGSRETLGVARAVSDPDLTEAEFAIIVRSDLKGHGLGHLLLEKLVRYCRERGMQRIFGETLHHNHGMRDLARSLGFVVTQGEEGCVNMDLTLVPERAA